MNRTNQLCKFRARKHAEVKEEKLWLDHKWVEKNKKTPKKHISFHEHSIGVLALWNLQQSLGTISTFSFSFSHALIFLFLLKPLYQSLPTIPEQPLFMTVTHGCSSQNWITDKRENLWKFLSWGLDCFNRVCCTYSEECVRFKQSDDANSS